MTPEEKALLERLVIAVESLVDTVGEAQLDSALESRRDHPSYPGLRPVCGDMNDSVASTHGEVVCSLPEHHEGNHTGPVRDGDRIIHVEWGL